MAPTGSPAAPLTAPGRGIKGLFSRRALSPEAMHMSARSRLRSLADEPGQARPHSPTGQMRMGRGRHRSGPGPKEARSRPPSPDLAGRNIRFALADLPVMQRGDDGRWQQPSLSKGSMSTSALAAYAEQVEEVHPTTPAGPERELKRKKTHKHSLSLLFNGTRFGAKSPVEGTKSKKHIEAGMAQLGATRPADSALGQATQQSQDYANKSLPRTPPPNAPEKHRAPTTTQKSPRSPNRLTPSKRSAAGGADSSQQQSRETPPRIIQPTSRSRTTRTPPSTPGLASSSQRQPTSQSRTTKTPPSTPGPASSSQRGSPPAPTQVHARRTHADGFLASSSSPGTAPLSREHYLIRVSASLLVKALTQVIRSANFAMTEKSAEMKSIAEGHLGALSRMERSWSGDWAKVTAAIGNPIERDEEHGEEALMSIAVGNRTRDRERKVWAEAINDGVLLCLLLNHLFPAQPPHIARVNISEDGIFRATNITRFITACHEVGLPGSDIFNLYDLSDAEESSLGRVAWTMIALARLAKQVGVGHSHSTAAQKPMPSPGSPNASFPKGPRRLSARHSGDAQIHSERNASPPSHTVRPFSQDEHVGSASSRDVDRTSFQDGTNDQNAKLQAVTSLGPPEADDSAFHTPTASTFGPGIIWPMTRKEGSGSSSGSVVRPSPMPRAMTQPNMSPSIRPRSSPSATSPSRSTTPIGKPLQFGVRPTLRPRHTTGVRSQVSFADAPDSPRSNGTSGHSLLFGAHSQERTPSLISSGSRILSGYTRSSAAFSVATVSGEDHSAAVEFAEDDDDDHANDATLIRRRERRMSEKTLHDARAKFFASVLSSEDTPESLHSLGDGDDGRRDLAISQSLATLEGARPVRPDVSPHHRHAARRQEVTKVIEEDELSSSSASEEGNKPLVARRLSLNGKAHAAARSLSPSRRIVPPESSQPFPFGLPSAPLPTSHSVSEYLPGPGSRMDRRQSEQYPPKQGDERFEPMNMRNQSMINLSTSARPSSLFRDNSTSSVLRASQPLQVLEFCEPGLPPIRYQLGNCIGRGQFGSVYRSLNLSTGQMVAIKRIRLHGMEEAEVRDVMREVELLKRLGHPSIVKYEGMSRDDEYLNIVLEFVENGSLGQTLKAFGNFNEKLVSSYVAKILEGLDYLHSQGVVHCDLKAANILSTKNGNVKLSDFGVSLNMKAVENIRQDATQGKTSSRDVAGTPNWMAPEVISLNGATPASDIWSLGCTIIELLTGKPPYAEVTNSMSVLFRIVDDEMPPLPDVSPDLEDFLKLCFVKDPNRRPGAIVLFEHPWVKKLNPELALRPQDSVPFLRRMSIDLRRVDTSLLFVEPAPSTDTQGEAGRRTRYSMGSSHGRDGSEGCQREHQLVRTTFSKAIICRICHTNLKKAGVLCQSCGLLCHTGCATKASPRCDVNEQLALLARQQDRLQPTTTRPTSRPPSRTTSSRPPSRQTSFERSELGASFTALPGRLLYQWKRSRSTLHVDLVDEDQGSPGTDWRRRSGSNVSRQLLKPERASLDTTRSHDTEAIGSHDRRARSVDSRLSRNSRNSVFSETSEEGSGRQSVTAVVASAASPGVRGDAIQEPGAQAPPPTVGAGIFTGEERRVKHVKAKESKSDCVVQ